MKNSAINNKKKFCVVFTLSGHNFGGVKARTTHDSPYSRSMDIRKRLIKNANTFVKHMRVLLVDMSYKK